MRKAVKHLTTADPVLGALIERVGPCRIIYMEPTFANLARSIVYQQLSGKAAATIFGRVLSAAGTPLEPAGILKLTVPDLRAAGLSQQKASYVRDLAEKTASGELSFERLRRLRNDQVIQELRQVKGVGVWTAQMFLMFALRRPNVLPVGDLGVRNAIRKAYELEALPTPEQIEQIAEGWHPYCSFASWYLWRSLELK
jgi:DNA-3-methyladenine glycosylase II